MVNGHGLSLAQDGWPYTRANVPTSFWSFLYTGFLSAVYGLVGHHPLVARLIQALLAGVLGPWLAWRLGKRLLGVEAGRAAALLSSFYLYFVYFSAALMTETFTILAILTLLERALALTESGLLKPRPRARLGHLGSVHRRGRPHPAGGPPSRAAPGALDAVAPPHTRHLARLDPVGRRCPGALFYRSPCAAIGSSTARCC